MIKVGIIADDFTGAGDVGLMLEKAGFRTEITVADSERSPRPPGGKIRAWVVDTESRALPPARAARRVGAAMRALKRWKADRYYKKIDSTMRGNLAAELSAFLRALPGPAREATAFVPAFPRVGRTVRGGILYVRGVPLARTAFARDPRCSVRSSSIAKMVGPVFSRLWVPDARTQSDLRRVAKRVALGGGPPADAPPGRAIRRLAAVGAAGLAEELSRFWRPHPGSRGRGGRPSFASRRPVSRGPVLVVVGSFHPVSRRQLARLEKQAAAFKKKGRVFVVRSPDRRVSPGAALTDVVRKAARIAKKFNVRRFVVTGGETAASLCRFWGLRRWKIEASLDTGTPLCRPVGDPRRADWRLVLKPGAFGDGDTLVKAVRHVA